MNVESSLMKIYGCDYCNSSRALATYLVKVEELENGDLTAINMEIILDSNILTGTANQTLAVQDVNLNMEFIAENNTIRSTTTTDICDPGFIISNSTPVSDCEFQYLFSPSGRFAPLNPCDWRAISSLDRETMTQRFTLTDKSSTAINGYLDSSMTLRMTNCNIYTLSSTLRFVVNGIVITNTCEGTITLS